MYSLKLSPNLRHPPIEDEVHLSKSKCNASSSLLAHSGLFYIASSNKQINLITLSKDEIADVIQKEMYKLEQALIVDFKKERIK